MDRLTLLSMQGGLLIFMGIVVYAAWRAQRRPHSDRGPIWFSLGFLIGGIGLLLQAYRGIIDPFYAIILGNFLFMLNYAFVERAIAITTKSRSFMYHIIAFIAVIILSFVYFTYFKPNVYIRSVEAIFVIPFMQLPIWMHLIRCKERRIKPATRAMAYVLLIHVLMNFVHFAGILISSKADAWFTWFGVISIAGLTLSFLWIDALRLREELERNAMTDPLTGLLNRRALDNIGLRELSRSVRLGLPWSALAIDLNQFKEINDTYGHSAGDRALCAVADALRSSLRLSDLATRLGGDEFLVLLPDSNEQVAEEVAARLTNAIEHATVETPAGQRFSLSVSIGSVTLRGENMTVDNLIHESDVRLYAEKRKLTLPENKALRSAWHIGEQGEVINFRSSGL